MKLISRQVESTWLASFACSVAGRSRFGCLGTPALCTRCCFSWEVVGREFGTAILWEITKGFTEACRAVVEVKKGCLCVHAKFSKSMPSCEFKEEIENDGVVWLREKAIKNWYCALSIESEAEKQKRLNTNVPGGYLRSLLLLVWWGLTHCCWIS